MFFHRGLTSFSRHEANFKLWTFKTHQQQQKKQHVAAKSWFKIESPTLLFVSKDFIWKKFKQYSTEIFGLVSILIKAKTSSVQS